MAGEILIVEDIGMSIYVILFNIRNKIWNNATSEFESVIPENWSDYAIPVVELAGTGLYFGDFPTEINVAGDYPLIPYIADTPGTPVVGDSPIAGANELMRWSGTAEMEVSFMGPSDMVAALYDSFVVNTTTFQKIMQGLAAVHLGGLIEDSEHNTSEFTDVNDPGTPRVTSTNTETTREVTLN